jgi:hypothetical protein
MRHFSGWRDLIRASNLTREIVILTGTFRAFGSFTG